MKSLSLLTFLSFITFSQLFSQFIFDEHFCEYYGDFAPFEYNENTGKFTFNLSDETCDPSADGSFNALNLMTYETDIFIQNLTYDIPGSEFSEGTPVHYCFKKQNGSNPSGDPRGTAYAGIKLNHDEYKGGLLLLINDGLLGQISSSLEQYRLALIGDGWTVSTLSVSSTDSVVAIKQMINDLYLSTGDLRSIFIIGDVPIPYSGSGIRPDGHEQHAGAWMADVYYADLDGVWTDNSINDVSSIYERHRNIPGDGKFDQTFCPSPTELEVGRIYFENLPIYTESPAELYERYLQKNIKYRTGKTQIDKEYVLHSQNVYPGHMLKDLWLLSGTAGMNRKFNQTGNLNFINETTNTSHRFGFGDSFGSATSCNNIVTSNQFAADSLQVSFVTLSGSYFGNWSYDNNLFSVACASNSNTIAATWGVFTMPFQYLQSGQTFGFCQKMSMHGYGTNYLEPNWVGFNNYPSHTVSNMLIGDPSLKTFILPKIQSLSLSNVDSTQVNLEWTEHSGSSILGYNVYRSSTLNGDFIKINMEYIQSSSYTDNSPHVGNNVYMIRSVKLDSSNVASFYTYSTGIIDSIDFQYADSDMDGYTSNEDCDDTNPDVNPGQTEVPYNGLDDDCDVATLDDDLDQDGFLLSDDCDDTNPDINPGETEIPYNGIDEDCNVETLDDDLDEDGFLLSDDCDDTNPDINPDADEIPNNGIDEDCDGMDLISSTHELASVMIEIFPNPVSAELQIWIDGQLNYQVGFYDLSGKLLFKGINQTRIQVDNLPNSTYILEIQDMQSGQKIVERVVVVD